MVSRWSRLLWICLLCLVVFATFAGSSYVDVEIFSLPLLTISIVTVLYLLSLALTRIVPDRNPHLNNPKLLDAGIFLSIVVVTVVGRTATSGVNDWFYPLFIGTTVILAFRVVLPPTRIPIHLTQIFLLALVARSTPWFSYPVFGQDRFHQTAFGHIVNTGTIVPETITYYANFPAAHVFAATFTSITGVELKAGYFSLGIVIAISLIGVYLLAHTVLTDERSALVATLFAAVAGYHVRAGAEPFAQALFTALIPFILYLLFRRDRSRRELYVLILLVVFASIIQNIAPLVLLGLWGVIVSSSWVLNHVPIVRQTGDFEAKYTVPLVVPALVGVVGVYYYVIADYLRFQTMRIIWLLEPLFGQSGTTGQATTEGTGVTGVPSVELFGYVLPDVLMWAAPVLTVAGVLILGAYHVVNKLIVGNVDITSLQYVLIASVTYAIFALVFASGGPADRALPSIIVLMAPVVGWVVLQFNNNQPIIGTGMTVIVILCIATAGILTPAVAKAEVSDNNFHEWMSAEETATVEFSMAYTDGVHSSSYYAGYEDYLLGIRGTTDESPTLNGSLNKNDPESVENYRSLGQSGESVIYSPYFRSAYGIQAPDTNKIYSTGYVDIYT